MNLIQSSKFSNKEEISKTKSSKTKRSFVNEDLINRAFVCLLVAWAVLVTPYVLFEDFFRQKDFASAAGLIYSAKSIARYRSQDHLLNTTVSHQ